MPEPGVYGQIRTYPLNRHGLACVMKAWMIYNIKLHEAVSTRTRSMRT